MLKVSRACNSFVVLKSSWLLLLFSDRYCLLGSSVNLILLGLGAVEWKNVKERNASIQHTYSLPAHKSRLHRNFCVNKSIPLFFRSRLPYLRGYYVQLFSVLPTVIVFKQRRCKNDILSMVQIILSIPAQIWTLFSIRKSDAAYYGFLNIWCKKWDLQVAVALLTKNSVNCLNYWSLHTSKSTFGFSVWTRAKKRWLSKFEPH